MKKILTFFTFFTFLILLCGHSYGATLMFEVYDGVNDLSTISEYHIFSKLTETGQYNNTASVIVTPANMDFDIILNNGNCFTLSIIVVDKSGRLSDRGAELTVCLDSVGNPTFPDGPSPASLIYLGAQ